MAEAEKWTIFRTRYTPCAWPIITYWSWPVKEVLGIEQGTNINVWVKGHITGYRERSAIQKMAWAALEIFKKNINNLHEMRENAVKAGEDAAKFTKVFATKAKTAPLEEFAQFFDEFNLVYQNVIRKSMAYWIYTHLALEPEVKKALANYSEAEASEIFSIMSLSTEKTYSASEEEEFEKVVEVAREKGVESKEAKNAIKQFSQKYFWFPYEYVGPEVWDEKTVTHRVNEALAKPLLRNKGENLAEKQKQCITKYKLDSETINLFKIMQAMGLMQDDRKMYQSQTCYYLDREVIGELAKRLSVPLEKARYIDAEILRNYIKTNDVTELHKRLNNRVELFLIVNRDDYCEVLEVEQAENYLHSQGINLQEDYSKVTEFKGQVANRGFAKGKARVLLSPDTGAEFNEGDILVTNMTTPNFINFIKKASAIITNEGGITCHAAIISRELGKPCIIGTKIATKVLKNGDLVEVDADNGVVKIISTL